jgi:AraC family transcriptional regulator
MGKRNCSITSDGGIPVLLDNLDQGTIHFTCNKNTLNFSSLREFYQPVTCSGFAIKYVLEGMERYVINKQAYEVSEGRYLLLNGTKEGYVEIESSENAKGICINIDNSFVAEVVASLLQPDTAYADPALATFFYTDQFLENQYTAAYTQLGKTVAAIGKRACAGPFTEEEVNQELFYTLAENLVADQLTVFKQMQCIRTVKPATRSNLYRRVLVGKEFIDASFQTQLTIEQVAKEAAVSEYHFFRLFRTVFGMSPHQYILRKRLETGKRLLHEQYPVSVAALECGFTDIHSFSKAFKHHFGVTPSSLLRQN